MQAIFAGTFDPFTAGHRDIAERALRIFGAVTIAVAEDTGKITVPLSERVKIAELSVSDLKNIDVAPFKGLLSDFVAARGECVLIRGVRNARDYDYERDLCRVYKSMCGVDAVHLVASPEFGHVSSTVVRELAALGNVPHGYVVDNAYSAVMSVYGK